MVDFADMLDPAYGPISLGYGVRSRLLVTLHHGHPPMKSRYSEVLIRDEHLALDGSACVNHQDTFFSGSA